LSINKTELSPGEGVTVKPGDKIRYRMFISNSGTGDINWLDVHDRVPGHTTLTWQGRGTEHISSDQIPGGVDGNGDVWWQQPSAPVGWSGYVDFEVQVSASAPDGSQICNIARISSREVSSINSNQVCNPVSNPPSPPPPPEKGCIIVLKETFNPQGNPITPVAQFTFQLDGSATAQNDSTGVARFDNVSPGAHTVSEINLPSGWTLISTTPSGGTVNVPSGTNCATVVFKNQQAAPPPPPPDKGCVIVLKETFNTQGNPITPVAQFTFQLDGTRTTTNDSTGVARFNDVSPGSHTVSEINIPSGWTLISTTPSGGTVNVPSGTNCATVVFKNQQVVTPPPPPDKGCVVILKEAFEADGDKITTVPQFTFRLDNDRTTMNDSAGNARFDDVSPGTHTISEINIPSGWTLISTTPSGGIVNVPSGTNCATVVFKNQQVTTPPPPPGPGCIEVHKETYDPQGNRITPVAQFTFKLDGSATATNDSTGTALFMNVSTGTHTVTEVLPSSWQQTSVVPSGGIVTVQSGTPCAQVTFKNKQMLDNPPPPPAPVCTLTINPTSITAGQLATLTWTTQNAVSVNISNIGTVALNGSQIVMPSVSTTYTLTATGSNNQTVQCSAGLTVNNVPPPPPPSGGGSTNNNNNNNSNNNTNNNNNSINNSGNSNNTNTNTNTVSPDINFEVNIPEFPYPIYSWPQYPQQQYYPQFQQPYFPPPLPYVPPAPSYPPPPQYAPTYAPAPQYPVSSIPLGSIPYTGFDAGPIADVFFWLGLIAMSFAGAYLIVYYRGGVRGFLAGTWWNPARFARG